MHAPISLSRWGAALAFSESTSTINRLEAIAFRVASVQSSPAEISRSVIQHLTCADSRLFANGDNEPSIPEGVTDENIMGHP
jgi:hypothetical protein